MHNPFGRNRCKRQAPTNPSNGYTICSLSTYGDGPATMAIPSCWKQSSRWVVACPTSKGRRIPNKQRHAITNMQVTSTRHHKVRYCVPLSWKFVGWVTWQLGLYSSTGIRCYYYIYCHSARSSTLQPNAVHTGRLPSQPTCWSDCKFLLNPFIALCPTILLILRERHHHQCWT